MTEGREKSRKDTQAFMVGGLFILGLIFATYTYFNKSASTGDMENGENTSTLEKLRVDFLRSKKRQWGWSSRGSG